MLHLELGTPEWDANFAAAPVYEKTGSVRARQVTETETVVTVLANGTEEASRSATPGEWIITNPGGEEYVMRATTFAERYEASETSGVYNAIGRMRAVPNTTRKNISIKASWGEMQYGGPDCFIAEKLNKDGTPSRYWYLIGGDELAATYRPVLPAPVGAGVPAVRPVSRGGVSAGRQPALRKPPTPIKPGRRPS